MNIWEGKFKNFKHAKSKLKGMGFSGKKWLEEQQNLFKDINKKFYKNNKKIPKKYIIRYIGILKILTQKFKNYKTIKILDVGGGYGIGFFYLNKHIKKKKLEYTILEIPALVKILKKKKSKINFISNYSIKAEYDIIICCSVFQYIENWKLIIKKLVNKRPKFIYFSDMFLGNIKSYVTLQNYYSHKIPHWILNFNSFNRELIKNNYNLISKRKMFTKRLNIYTKLPMSNFKVKDRLPFTLKLLYKKH